LNSDGDIPLTTHNSAVYGKNKPIKFMRDNSRRKLLRAFRVIQSTKNLLGKYDSKSKRKRKKSLSKTSKKKRYSKNMKKIKSDVEDITSSDQNDLIEQRAFPTKPIISEEKDD